MPTYVGLFNYTQQGIQNVKDSPARLDTAKKAAQAIGVEIKQYYLVMGQYDLIVIAEAPDDETIAKLALATDYMGHISFVPGGAVRGREALKQLFTGYWASFDVHAASEPDLLLAEGEFVAHRETIRVKHKGVFQGLPPTGKEATITSMDIYRIMDGKIVEQWTESDMLGLMQQLGVIPASQHAHN